MHHFLASATEGQTKVLLTLFVMLAVAKIMAEVFELLRQPPVVGEILAGVLIGPSLLGWVTPSEITETLARVLTTMGVLNAMTSRIILGAAVIDDILGLMILAVVHGLALGPINYLSIITTAILAIAFTVFMASVGAPVVKKVAPKIENMRGNQALFVMALLLCLGISVAATFVGVAAIVGAFLAGMAFAEVAEERPTMHKQMSGVMEFLVPFFLVNIGMQLKLEVFRDLSVVGFAVLVTLVAVIAKLVGCGIGAMGLGWRRASQVGMGMVPRGEVGIVVAQIGLGMGVISDSLYGVVLMMAVVTTLIAPPFLRMLYAEKQPATAARHAA